MRLSQTLTDQHHSWTWPMATVLKCIKSRSVAPHETHKDPLCYHDYRIKNG